MPTITVLEADGTTETDVVVNDNGRAAAAASKPVALSNEDFAVLDGLETAIAATNTAIAATNTLLTTLSGYLDGIETLIGTTNTNTGDATTSLQTLDDWDESDRAKVNPIVGQAGITAGAGAVAANSPRVTLASDDPAVAHLATLVNTGSKPAGRNHEYVAASQTDQMCGSTGAAGDILDGVLIVPATTSPGAVSIEYGSTNITIFTGGASSVSNLVPFWVECGSIESVGGGWEVTTGANVSVIAVGKFT